MKKWVTVLMLMSSLIILSACSESEAEVDLSNYPESVQNGEISAKFYDDLTSFIDNYDSVYYGMTKISEAEETFPDIILKKEYVDSVNTMIKAFEENVEPIKLKPKTEKDKELNQIAKNIIALQSEYNKDIWMKAENALYEKETTLFVDRALLENAFKQLKKEIE